MTVPAPPTGSGRRVAVAVFLMIAPIVLAPFFLTIGLFGSLLWVYVSIALAVLWVPCVVVGVVLLARDRSGTDGWTFAAPPGWPRPPQGWAPGPGWAPDPSWPAAPPDWRWWTREHTKRR